MSESDTPFRAAQREKLARLTGKQEDLRTDMERTADEEAEASRKAIAKKKKKKKTSA